MIAMRALLPLLLVGLITRTALAAGPQDVRLQEGVKAFAAEDYPKAVEELSASIKAQPSAKAALYLGNAYLKLGQLAKAKEALELALRIEPASAKREGILKLIQGIEARIVGTVQLSSTPAGATIRIDGEADKPRGKTPLTLSLPPGQHRVDAELAGYEHATAAVEVKAGETTALGVDLRALGCELALSVTPPGGNATVDGGAAVALPAKVRVGPGDHQVEYSAAGFRSAQRSVRCTGGAAIELVITLAALPRGPEVVRTGLELTLTVPQVTLEVDGVPRAAGRVIPLAAGLHRLHASAAGYRSLSDQVQVVDGELLAAKVELSPSPSYALGAALSLTALAVVAEATALGVHFQANPAPSSASSHEELALHGVAGAMAVGALVGYVLHFTTGRSRLVVSGQRSPRLGAGLLPQAGTLMLTGHF